MKYITLFFLMLLLISCSNYPDGRVGIYVVDMMNDEKYRYRIIRLVDLAEENEQLIGSDINLDLPENKALSDEINYLYSEEFIYDKKELIGRDVALSFPSFTVEMEISRQVHYGSHCYLYYLKGYFVSGDNFFVEEYQLLPLWAECIKSALDTYKMWEFECANSDDDECRTNPNSLFFGIEKAK